ncbi:MAG TPA: oxidoreductase [Solirubrobacteraceae bacterium]|jgi:NAD(P)-dependent dehydrogenase (short-subunit alcohol dehydrogenase family)|nr:oxidoreductase [Solirubrobacteraceae bacterium]
MATWLITGCSTGLGHALAQAALEHGDNVVATARDTANLQTLVDAHPDSALAVTLDVTNQVQIDAAVDAAQQRFRGVDVLVNNAGYGYRGAVEEASDADARTLFDTHFFGSVAMIKAVLPGMRARRSGTIVTISSIGARITPPGSGYYSAAKAALEGMSGSLRTELEPLGITAMIVEPGGFRTDFSGRSLRGAAVAIADYAETVGPRRKENDTSHGTQAGDPAKAALAIISAVESPAPPAVLLLGSDALDAYRRVLDAQRAETDEWETTSRSTDF